MENTKDKMSSENIDNQDGGKVPQREKKGQGFRLEHWHIIALGLMLYDSLALSFSYLIALGFAMICATAPLTRYT